MKKINDDKIPVIQCPVCMKHVNPAFYTNHYGVENKYHYEHFCHRSFTIQELDKMEKK